MLCINILWYCAICTTATCLTLYCFNLISIPFDHHAEINLTTFFINISWSRWFIVSIDVSPLRPVIFYINGFPLRPVIFYINAFPLRPVISQLWIFKIVTINVYGHIANRCITHHRKSKNTINKNNFKKIQNFQKKNFNCKIFKNFKIFKQFLKFHEIFKLSKFHKI